MEFYLAAVAYMYFYIGFIIYVILYNSGFVIHYYFYTSTEDVINIVVISFYRRTRMRVCEMNIH